MLIPVAALCVASALVPSPNAGRVKVAQSLRLQSFGEKRGKLLPSTITASGAGTTADNGSYSQSVGNDSHGNKYFQVGTSAHYIYYNASGTRWAMGSVLDDWTAGPPYPSVDYYGPPGDSPTSINLTATWTANSGAAPPPTFTTATVHKRRPKATWF